MIDRHLRLALAAAGGLVLAGALSAPAPARAVEGLIFSGSVFVDQWGFVDNQAAVKNSPAGMAPMTSMKVGADIPS